MSIQIIFAPQVETSIKELIDFCPIDSLPSLINFIDDIQARFIELVKDYPASGSPFQGDLRYVTIRSYSFIYRFDELSNKIIVLDFIGPGQDWR